MAELRALLLSLRPQYAEAILAGHKTIELRRRRVAATPGTQVVLYATRPTGAVVGLARLRESITCPPDDAWDSHASGLAIDRTAFDAYLAGTAKACLLMLDGVARIDPVPLDALRSGVSFRPPQSYRYVSADDPAAIRDLLAPGWM